MVPFSRDSALQSVGQEDGCANVNVKQSEQWQVLHF